MIRLPDQWSPANHRRQARHTWLLTILLDVTCWSIRLPAMNYRFACQLSQRYTLFQHATRYWLKPLRPPALQTQLFAVLPPINMFSLLPVIAFLYKWSLSKCVCPVFCVHGLFQHAEKAFKCFAEGQTSGTIRIGDAMKVE